MAKEIKVSLTQGQAEFVSSKAKFPLYCAGYGAGKSHVMGFCVATDLLHSASCIVGVYEPEWTHIKSIAVPRISHWLSEFGITHKTNWQDHCIYTSSPGVGDVLLKSMDNPDALVGYETYRSHIDELDTLPADKAEQVFFKVMGRNRQAPSDVPKEHREYIEKNERWECINRIYSYTTPEGFKFCHKMWSPDSENAVRNPEFQLYKGKTSDNPTLTEAYLQQLESAYPANLLRAYMEGEFVNLESGTVYHVFNRHTHYTNRTVQTNDVLHIGVDFNVGKTCGIVFVDDKDCTSIVAEVVNKYDTPDLINELKARWPRNQILVYPDATGVKRGSANASVSDIALLEQAGYRKRANGHNPRVQDRINAVNKKFANNTLFVNTIECPETVKCLEQQAYDKNGDPDKKSGYDHALDALGYRIHYSFSIARPVFSFPFTFASRRN